MRVMTGEGFEGGEASGRPSLREHVGECDASCLALPTDLNERFSYISHECFLITCSSTFPRLFYERPSLLA